MIKFIGKLYVHQLSFSVGPFTTFAFAMLPHAANLDKRASSIKHRVFPGLLQNRQLISGLLSDMVIHRDESLG